MRKNVKKGMVTLVIFLLVIVFDSVGVLASTPSYGYNAFEQSFRYTSGAPSSDNCLSQTVKVKANGVKTAYVYNYKYNVPESGYVTQEFTGVTQPLKYSIIFLNNWRPTLSSQYSGTKPKKGKHMIFRGRVTDYTVKYFTIRTGIKG
jgi:hypothetical protein